MGLFSSLLFGSGRGAKDKKTKIIQEAAAGASERRGLAKLLRGPYADAGYRRKYKEATRQEVKQMRQDVRVERVHRQREREREDQRWDLAVDRELGVSALRDRVRREEALGRSQAAERLKGDLASRERILERRRLERSKFLERADRQFEFDVQRREKDYYRQSGKQWHEGFGTARDQVERQRRLQQYVQEQSNLQRGGASRPLGQGGFRYTNPGPSPGGPRSTYTRPGQ